MNSRQKRAMAAKLHNEALALKKKIKEEAK